jgi:cytidylate kinase
MSKNLVIAIDGPAGSGKSTTAQFVAQKLGYIYIDTGAMYRAITFLAIRNNILGNKDRIIELTVNSEIELRFNDFTTEISVNGEDLTDMIRTIEVNKNVSYVSKIEEVRRILVDKQRKISNTSIGVVMEGRDIGTVVFPNADVKIFLTATIDERSSRRAKEYAETGAEFSIDEIKENLENRDKIDSNRNISPLKQAEDAVVVDTSNVTVDEQVNLILAEVNRVAQIKGTEIKIKR